MPDIASQKVQEREEGPKDPAFRHSLKEIALFILAAGLTGCAAVPDGGERLINGTCLNTEIDMSKGRMVLPSEVNGTSVTDWVFIVVAVPKDRPQITIVRIFHEISGSSYPVLLSPGSSPRNIKACTTQETAHSYMQNLRNAFRGPEYEVYIGESFASFLEGFSANN